MKKKVLLLLILLLLMSCGGKNKSENNLVLADNVIYNAFEGIPSDTLVGQIVDVEIPASLKIFVHGDLLVALHHTNKTKYNYSVYNKNSMELIGGYINKGRAFNELLGGSDLYDLIEKSDTLEMIINDFSAQKIKRYIVPKVTNDSCVISAKLFLETEFLRKYRISTINWDFDNKSADFIWQNEENNLAVSYRKINFDGEVIADKEIMKPELNYKEKTYGGKLVYSIFHTTKKDKSKFVFHSTLNDQINIFDYATGKITTSTKLSEIPASELLNATNYQEASEGIFKYVGVVYSGDNYFLMRYLNSRRYDQDKMTLHLYDWNGNGKAIFIVDNSSFAVDEENGILYGLNIKTDVLKKYDIGKYLK